MFLEKIKIEHFRKFNENQNEIVFFNNPVNNNVDIANISTLIVGQNNAGKSTIFKAFELLSTSNVFVSTDFNYEYLRTYVSRVLNGEVDDNGEIIPPFMRFEFVVDISDDDKENITQAVALLNVSSLTGDINKGKLIVEIRLKDENSFKTFMKKKTDEYVKNTNEGKKITNFEKKTLTKVCELIDEIGMTQCCYNSQAKIEFKFNDLFNFKLIDALSVDDECVLSKQFKKILKYHFAHGNLSSSDMDSRIEELNNQVGELLEDEPSSFINTVMGSMVSKNMVQMKLQGSITFENILDNSVKYFYNEKDFTIPEDHYGLGYTKLVSIIANLLEYVEKKPNKDFDNKISIVAIEEPETFMHPQLQKCFIKNINDVLATILTSVDKKIKCQLVISTHSPHIVSNKIEESCSINNINYLGMNNYQTHVVLLDDNLFKRDGDNSFKNIKKHMSFPFAEALFADALILVEGFAEEKLIPYFLSNYDNLKNKFISIINIHGAHGFVYQKLIKALNIPAVIVTDIDFVHTKDDLNQIKEYNGNKTTNKTIINNIGSDDLSSLKTNKIDVIDCENMKIFVQKVEYGYCGTSFEEALILANYDNTILINSLISARRNSFYKITDYKELSEEKMFQVEQNIKDNSKKLYDLLSDVKGDFTTLILKELFQSSTEIRTPSYILDAFDYLYSEVDKNEQI